ncbi:MAG: tetratricopeptide repeat protein [Pseudomonadota bacterium]
MQERLEAAQALEQAGRVVDAEKEFRAINEALNGHPLLFNLIAQNLIKQRRYREAVDAFKNGLEVAREPNDIEHLLFHAAMTCYDHLNIREGIELLESRIHPPYKNTSTTQLLVQGYSLLSEIDQCMTILDQIQSQDPKDFWPLDTACQILSTHERYDEAIERLKASTFDKHSVDVNLLLYNLYSKKNAPAEALKYLARASEQSPDDINIKNSLLWHYWAMGEEEAAKQTASAINTRAPDAKFSLSNFQLALGNMKQGLPGYDYIYATSFHREKERLIPLPRAFNIAQFMGKRVLLTADQGVGDQIRFSRHFYDLDASRYQKLWIACDPRLLELFQASFPHLKFIGEDKLNAEWAQREGFDIELKHPSAANMAKRRAFEPLPGYLQATENRFSERLEELRSIGKPLVGLCWRSVINSPERRHWYYPLAGYARALRDAGATVISLQNNVSNEERATFKENAGFELIELPDFDPKDDLANLASVCQQLDLVIATGTATSDLSGAVGAPTLLTAKRFPDRWYLSKDYLKQYYPNTTPLVLNMHQDWAELDPVLNSTLQSQLAKHA